MVAPGSVSFRDMEAQASGQMRESAKLASTCSVLHQRNNIIDVDEEVKMQRRKVRSNQVCNLILPF